jgi:hypothetical protein
MYVTIAAPDTADDPKKFAHYWLNAFFVHQVSGNHQVLALAHTYVRLVEAALVEFREGVRYLHDVWETHTSLQLGSMNRSIAHFESCVSDMYRAVNCFRSLRRHRSRDPLSQAVAADKPGFASDGVARRFNKVRHELHHMEEVLVQGRLKQGEPFVLAPTGPEVPHPIEEGQTIKTVDRLRIGTREILFTELVGWLQEMTVTAIKIADFVPPSAPASPASGDA